MSRKKSNNSKRQNKKRKDEVPPKRSTESNEEVRSKLAEGDLSIININLAIFGIFIALIFSYFVYFSHQLTEIKSEIHSKILEINAINPPFPWSFLSITGHNEYYYLKRRKILFEEFRRIKESLQDTDLNEATMSKLGKQAQVLITQIAYFFPYKRMLDFQKDGSVTFDPNRFESIETVENLKTNIPAYAISRDADRTYSPEFIKEQVDHINNSHRRFNLELKDGKDRIIEAMTLANGLNKDYDKTRLRKYIESLIEYLENHYKLAIPLGLKIKKYDYLIKKSNLKIIVTLSILLFINFMSGVVLPLLWRKTRNKRLFMVISLLTFFVGIVILFLESLYSLPI